MELLTTIKRSQVQILPGAPDPRRGDTRRLRQGLRRYAGGHTGVVLHGSLESWPGLPQNAAQGILAPSGCRRGANGGSSLRWGGALRPWEDRLRFHPRWLASNLPDARRRIARRTIDPSPTSLRRARVQPRWPQDCVVSADNETHQIYIMNSDGSQVTRLANPRDRVAPRHLAQTAARSRSSLIAMGGQRRST
jgi:hypothetical protein